jgi:hypothetical protein
LHLPAEDRREHGKRVPGCASRLRVGDQRQPDASPSASSIIAVRGRAIRPDLTASVPGTRDATVLRTAA